MAARAIWKGVLRLGQKQLGVKLYSAVQDRDVHFKLLDRKSHGPVAQRMINPETEEPVEYQTIQKGFFSDGSYVMLSKAELEGLAPEPSRDIEVDMVVSDDKFGPEWFVRPYYLGPDGDADRYGALAKALFEEKREGLAHWTMRGIEYTGVLRSDGQHLMLITMRHKDEVVSAEELPDVQGPAHSDKEAKMAEQLVLAYEDEFDPAVFKNEHRDRVLALIEAKAKGKRLRLPALHEKRAAPNLADALKKSLLSAHAKSKDGAKGSARSAARKQEKEAGPKGPRATRSRRRKEHAVA